MRESISTLKGASAGLLCAQEGRFLSTRSSTESATAQLATRGAAFTFSSRGAESDYFFKSKFTVNTKTNETNAIELNETRYHGHGDAPPPKECFGLHHDLPGVLHSHPDPLGESCQLVDAVLRRGPRPLGRSLELLQLDL